jgi:hypothetical protein
MANVECRVYFCGDEAEVEVGRDAVHRGLEALDGRPNEPRS